MCARQSLNAFVLDDAVDFATCAAVRVSNEDILELRLIFFDCSSDGRRYFLGSIVQASGQALDFYVPPSFELLDRDDFIG